MRDTMFLWAWQAIDLLSRSGHMPEIPLPIHYLICLSVVSKGAERGPALRDRMRWHCDRYPRAD